MRAARFANAMIKQAIVSLLGEKELLLPDLVASALAANGRAKYYFTLLQLACSHAAAPYAPVPDLRGEREAEHIDDDRFDRVVGASRILAGRYRIPLLETILDRLSADVRAMIEPLRVHSGESDPQVRSFEDRFSAISASLPHTGTAISTESVAALTSSERDRRDSAHLLVIDLHKAVDSLVASLATEEVDGAKAFRLAVDDRALVAAFMAGVHRTEAARIGHPGLGTTATRTGTRLVIENDIGATSAHVIVVHVDGLGVSITATDVHVRRLEFLEQLMTGFSMQWTDPRSRRAREIEGVRMFYECMGRFGARDPDELHRFLRHLGSEIVFLIDWNHARKVVRRFVPRTAAIALLAEAAAEGYGHRGFLEMGGDRLVFDAMASVIRTPLRFGERLDDVLGPQDAASFLRSCLRTCGRGMQRGHSRSLIQAHLRAELANLVNARGDRLLGPIFEHAGVIAELARGLLEQLTDPTRDQIEAATTAKTSERRADELVIFVRSVVGRRTDAEGYRRVIEAADDAADAFEEAAFTCSLLVAAQRPLLAAVPLVALSELAVRAADLYASAINSARNGIRSIQGTLEAVDAIIALERRMDEAQRATTRVLVHNETVDFRLFTLASRICRECERAVDALTYATLVLRDQIAGA